MALEDWPLESREIALHGGAAISSHVDSRARSQRNQAARQKQAAEKKDARIERRATPEQRTALHQARVVRDRELAAISADLKPQIDRLQRELRDRRLKAFDEYDERARLIRHATILGGS